MRQRRRMAAATLGAVLASAAAVSAEGAVVIAGATVHTLAGPSIEHGIVVVVGETVAAVGAAGAVEIPADAVTIEGQGLVVSPGLFDAMSTLGLSEIGSVSATEDARELGSWNPHLRALDAVHPASEHVAVARANGVTHVVAAPAVAGFGIAGRASAFHLDGWTTEEMVIAPEVGVVVDWPELQTRRLDRGTMRFSDRPYTDARREYDQRVGEIEGWIRSARRYGEALGAGDPALRPESDLRLASLVDVVERRLPILVRADSERQIRDAVALAQRQSLRLVLVGGADAWRLTELLADAGTAVILGPTLALPRRDDDPYDRPFTLARDLRAAGIEVAISTFSAAGVLDLPYQAGQAVAFGMPWEEGLAAITRAPAEILGLGERLGTIEPGKIANLLVTDGDPLELRTRVVQVLVRGRLADLESRHTRSYRRYRARPAPGSNHQPGAGRQAGPGS